VRYYPILFSTADTLHSGPEEAQVARAKVLTDDLLIVVRQEHAKVKVIVQQQQMELHQAQAQFAAYSVLGVRPNISLLLLSQLQPHFTCSTW
jgi:hypothetical protein